jgi:hypothetical protein
MSTEESTQVTSVLQVSGLQKAGASSPASTLTQAPLAHVRDWLVQLWQLSPPCPHASGASPATHRPDWQQPAQF